MRGDQYVEELLEKHLTSFFAGHEIAYCAWAPAPLRDRVPGFRIARIGPGPRTPLWTYVSLGAWCLHRTEGLMEFSIFSAADDPRFVELLAMTAFYHSAEQLGVGHTFPIGEAWVAGSSCHHVLVSRPYPLGQEFELCGLGDSHLHILWLLPITQAERDYLAARGSDALEDRFDAIGLEYWKFDRSSVV